MIEMVIRPETIRLSIWIGTSTTSTRPWPGHGRLSDPPRSCR
jgi:hypothetical protein